MEATVIDLLSIITMPTSTRPASLRRAAALGLPLLASLAAEAQISVTSGTSYAAAEGSSGRRGSSSGLQTDLPENVTGTSGVLYVDANITAGPVAPGVPLVTFPGTTCVVQADSYSTLSILGSSTFHRFVTQGLTSNLLTAMDGPELQAGAGANGSTDVRFSITQSMSYRLSGTAAFDNEDVSGSVVLYRGILPMHSVFVAQNGSFNFSGVLTPGNYRLHCASNVFAVAGADGVPMEGEFSERSEYSATLFVGCSGLFDQPVDAVTCPRGSARYSVTGDATGPVSFRWQIETGPGEWTDLTDGQQGELGIVSGSNTSELELEFPSPGATANIRCVLSTPGCDDVYSDVAFLTVCDYSADANCDGNVDLVDLATLLTNFGTAGGAGIGDGDTDQDGDVDLSDLSAMLTQFGQICRP